MLANHQFGMTTEDLGGVTSSVGHGIDDIDFFTLDDFLKDADDHDHEDGDVALYNPSPPPP